MQREHRGHIIRLVEGPVLRAELIERETGVVLPTTVTASAAEGGEILAARACALIDIYLESRRLLDRRRGSAAWPMPAAAERPPPPQ